jgi:ABC-type antimicrobial peptide transport system permease subunit
VARLVVLEAIVLCLLGALGGIALALLIEPILNIQLAGVLGSFQLRWTDAILALAIAAGMGVSISIPSALAAQRLAIVDALRVVH